MKALYLTIKCVLILQTVIVTTSISTDRRLRSKKLAELIPQLVNRGLDKEYIKFLTPDAVRSFNIDPDNIEPQLIDQMRPKLIMLGVDTDNLEEMFMDKPDIAPKTVVNYGKPDKQAYNQFITDIVTRDKANMFKQDKLPGVVFRNVGKALNPFLKPFIKKFNN